MEEQIRIQVPYFSQYRDVSDEAWQFRACAIVNLKMVLEYYKNKYPERGIPSNSIEDLITQGVQLNGYIMDVVHTGKSSGAVILHLKISLLKKELQKYGRQ